MIYLLVKDGLKIKEKRVYSGNDQSVRAAIDVEKLTKPSLSFEEVSQVDFDAAVADKEQTQGQKDWDGLKAGATPAVHFLAKYLGLE